MKKLIPLFVASAVMSGCVSTTSQETEIKALKTQLKELEINQRILASRLKLQGVTGIPDEVVFEDGIAFGDPNAPIAIVEFTDIQCPFCEKFQIETFPQLKEKYIDTGIVYFVAREMPLTSIHPQAKNAAIALRCAAEQDKAAYESMKVDLFKKRKELTDESYGVSAEAVGINLDAFQQCFDSQEVKDSVNHAYKYGFSMGVSSTPSLVFGYNTGTSAKDYRIGKGALTIEQIDEAIALFTESKED
ncbi:TPA: DsbA family protein [Vibrio parahaemolyticus]|jgi:protein-disulfide isomerase|uniref:DsbA family protein n=1 Tax=Vibrio parahaemolyticus TaxID=670 RepID=UPI003AB09D6C|nr:DsbA family protein [Vibrio parahaemolyticus]HCG6647445.1 DsbA family protein [Vibrio parahaemolyticus]